MIKKKMVILIACLIIIGIIGLTACGGKTVNKIDIGGEIVKGKIPATCQVRVMFDGDIFKLENEIPFSVGFGLLPGSDNEGYQAREATIVLSIESQGFAITNEENSKNDLYEKEFAEYSDNKFVCTLDNKRYIPNYYEIFELKLNSDSTSGVIQISAILYDGEFVSGGGEGIYYAVNNDRIALSAVSIEDAQEKLK